MNCMNRTLSVAPPIGLRDINPAIPNPLILKTKRTSVSRADERLSSLRRLKTGTRSRPTVLHRAAFAHCRARRFSARRLILGAVSLDQVQYPSGDIPPSGYIAGG